jgi:phosphate transport system substrate-binding protein
MKTLAILAGIALAATSAVAGHLINGAGATFPFPLYSKWFADYNKAHPDVQINYQSIGSGGGIKQITEGTVDFGASDAPMSDEQMQKATAKHPAGLQHIPTVMGAVVLIYNVPGVSGLRLTPEALAKIYLGKITKWNDPAIAAENKQLKLPDTGITVAHRSDGSGTTNIFTDYLSKISADWRAEKTGPGRGTSVNWPVGLGGKGNDGVTGIVKETPGAIGYVELAYANQNKLTVTELRNHDGEWVKPTLDAVSEAASKVEMPDDYRVSITDQPGKGAWPIAAFTYLLIDKDSQDAVKGPSLLAFTWWAEHEGQSSAAPLDYAPLPSAVVKKVEATLRQMRVAGKAVIATGK